MQLSEKIKIIRKARGFSQEGLGYSLSRVSKDGISRQSISDWENGKSEPKLDNIRDLASVLNVSFDALLDESVDLNDPTVLTSVLSRSNAPSVNEDTVYSNYRYRIYVSTVSVKSFKHLIACGCALVLTIIAVCLMIVLDNLWLISFVAISGGLMLGQLIVSVMDITNIVKGREREAVGEINNSHLIIYAYKDVANTLFIPIRQIEKMELGAVQKKRCGEIVIYVAGKSRPITNTIINPQKLIEVWTRLSDDSRKDEFYGE